MCNKTKCKTKKHFCKCCLQCFSGEKILIKHKENCSIINDKQTVKSKSDSTEFKNHFKKLSVPFKTYADFESLLKGVTCRGKNNSSYTEKYQDHNPCSFAFKFVCIDNKFSKPVVLYRGKNAAYKFIEAVLKERCYCKKVIKKHFNKNLVLSAEDEQRFLLSNICRICNKLFDVQDDKLRYQCHVTKRGSSHRNCNI